MLRQLQLGRPRRGTELAGQRRQTPGPSRDRGDLLRHRRGSVSLERPDQGTGVRVTVVRPGFVHTRMTRGMRSAPLATTPRVVAELTVAGMHKGRHTVWAPGALRYVFMVLRHVPRPIFRRLPLG